MQKLVPLSELEARMNNFRARMDKTNPEWEIAVIFSKINHYYFTGTMQDGMLIIPRDGSAVLWVRKSYERALDESFFPEIKPMGSFRDAAAHYLHIPKTVHIETEFVPIAILQRFQKHFPFQEVKSLDNRIAAVRSVKSEYELSLMRKSGDIHRRVLEDIIPGMLKEGISEVEFAMDIYSRMVKEGHHGLSRFAMFDTEMLLGQVCFGVSSIYPSYFNGPGGNFGMNSAVPLIGSRENKLKKGDLVYVDVGCGIDGYHTDKTMTYMYGKSLPEHAVRAHDECVAIQNEIAGMLKPGAIPSEIYTKIMNKLDPEFVKNFMGFGNRRVKFLGHGVGLQIDEYPVIAEGFNEPILEGMAFALEPKNGIESIGMVGIENTCIVTKDGAECITGVNPGLIKVY